MEMQSDVSFIYRDSLVKASSVITSSGRGRHSATAYFYNYSLIFTSRNKRRIKSLSARDYIWLRCISSVHDSPGSNLFLIPEKGD